MINIEYLMQFILAYYAPARAWGDAALAAWLMWHDANGRAKWVVDDGGRIIGFGIARPIMYPKDAEDTTAIDPEGGILMIDMLISRHPRAFQEIVAFARHRFGVRPYICFQRAGGPFKVYPSARFFRQFDPVTVTA